MRQPQEFQAPPWAKQQQGPPLKSNQPGKPGDGQVEGYERVVNGKVVKVNAYGKKPSTSTSAAAKARLLPGRPRIMAQPGTYASGRDLPGVQAQPLPPEPAPVPQFGKAPHGGQPQPGGVSSLR